MYARLIFDEKIILNECNPGLYSFSCTSIKNGETLSLRKGYDLSFRYLIKVRSNSFLQNLVMLYIKKNAELNVDFKNTNLPYCSARIHQSKVLPR
jgi:hypothetical protein